MNTVTESTAELLRARDIAPMLDGIHVACLFAVEAAKGTSVDLPATPARQLQNYGLVELGKLTQRGGRTSIPAALSSLGRTVIDVLVLEGRQVKGIGKVKRSGNYLYTTELTDMRTIAYCNADLWRCAVSLSDVLQERVVLMFPDLRWS